MNIYAIIILTAILAGFALNLAANLLNLKSLKTSLPPEFSDVYDQERYEQSQAYTRAQTRFGMAGSAFGLILILVFWFSGGFNILDQYVRSFGWNEIWTGLAYIGILLLGRGLLSLPFSIYATFVIEERFGFNKTTPATFISDLVKGLLLSVLAGGPILAGILALFIYAGSLAWLYCWIAVTLYTLVIQFIAPAWIMPLFNKFTPLEEGELRERIMEYARSVDFPLKNLFVMDGSKRSAKSNAFFTGFGKNKRIALFDTLIEKHTVPELVAVLAHEIGHYKMKHILKGMVISIAHTGIIFYLLSVFLTSEALFEAFYMEQMSVHAGLIFFGLLYAPVELVLSIGMQMMSRKHEYEADHFSAMTTGKPDAMIGALKKLSAGNLSNLTPHPFFVFLNYSHPPVLKRIEAIRGGAVR
jgi:STE24 endopeptidase